MSRFMLLGDICHGEKDPEELKDPEGEKAFLILCDPSLKEKGLFSLEMERLQQTGMEVRAYEAAATNPSIESMMTGLAYVRAFEPDWVLALGAEDWTDAAKVMWTLYEQPEAYFKNRPHLQRSDGEEAEPAAVPPDPGFAAALSGGPGLKDSGNSYDATEDQAAADLTACDPEFLCKSPQELTACIGMDTLAHALEIYVSTEHDDYTDSLSVTVSQIVLAFLEGACHGDAASRSHMRYAQCLACMASSDAGLGIAHSLAHQTCTVFAGRRITHGLAVAMYLPYVIRYNAADRPVAVRYGEIARKAGLPGSSRFSYINNLCEKIRQFNRIFGIPDALRQLDISETEFLRRLPNIAESVVSDRSTDSNPRPVDADRMEKLLKYIYYGEQVDF